MNKFEERILHNQIRIMEALREIGVSERLEQSLTRNMNKSFDIILSKHERQLEDSLQKQIKESVKEENLVGEEEFMKDSPLNNAKEPKTEVEE